MNEQEDATRNKEPNDRNHSKNIMGPAGIRLSFRIITVSGYTWETTSKLTWTLETMFPTERKQTGFSGQKNDSLPWRLHTVISQ